MSATTPKTHLRAERKRRQLTVREVAAAVGTDPSNMSRLELGTQTPTRDVARALFKFYRGRVTLGDIYDPSAEDEFARRCRRRWLKEDGHPMLQNETGG